MWAVRENHVGAAQLLLAHGADVDAQTRTGPAPAPRPPGAGGGSHGGGIVRGGGPKRGARATQPGAMTPLLYAARDGRLPIVSMLITAGGAGNPPDRKGTHRLFE